MLRRTPLSRKTPLRSGGPLRRVAMKVRRRDTGPDKATRGLVAKRSGGRCEWPGCTRPATDIHHRMNRQGPRGKEALAWLNAPSNLLHACRPHHESVTSVHGEALERAKRDGWVLEQWQTPAEVPVMTRHDRLPVLLMDGGGYQWQTEEGWAPG